jgi:cytokinin riboside 5'-monophosphate phosphoribohydrolase
MSKAVCVYSASSRLVDPAYFRLAEQLGEAIAARGYTLVFGGADIGPMGAAAHAAKRAGGRVVGVLPRVLEQAGLAFLQADELIVSADLRERKALMDARSDGFVTLPGGFGTLDEVFEAVSLRVLKQHLKPVVFLNHDGFFDGLFLFLDALYDRKFIRADVRNLYHASADVAGALDHIASHAPLELADKWAAPANGE